MTDPPAPVGSISWIDLTVPNADDVRTFYEQVVGWKSSPVQMGDYQDHCVSPPDDETPVAGICHARGDNADLPAQWLIYINVADLAKSIETCHQNGGRVVQEPREIAGGKCAVIQDPAGAFVALFEPPPKTDSAVGR